MKKQAISQSYLILLLVIGVLLIVLVASSDLVNLGFGFGERSLTEMGVQQSESEVTSDVLKMNSQGVLSSQLVKKSEQRKAVLQELVSRGETEKAARVLIPKEVKLTL